MAAGNFCCVCVRVGGEWRGGGGGGGGAKGERERSLRDKISAIGEQN